MLGLSVFHPALSETILLKDISTLITSRVTSDGKVEVLHDQSVLVENGVISKISPIIDGVVIDKVINAKGKIVQPGFVDTHDHLWQVTIRGCGNDQDLGDWVPDCDVVQTDITKEEAFAAVRLATYDLINTGVTTVMDWNHTFNEGHAYGALDALQQSGLRYVYGFNPHNVEEFDKNAAKIKKLIDNDRLGSFEIASHPALYMKPIAAKAVQLSRELDVPLNFHYGESYHDKKDQQTQVMKDIGAYSRPLVLNHVIHVNDTEIKLMVDAHARLTHNPLSNMRLASGVMPIGKLHDAGLTVGLGLDGAANDNADFFALMKATVGLQRAAHERPNTFPNYREVELLATIEGAKVLGLANVTGSIEVGKAADIIMINPKSTNMAASFDEVAQISLNSEPANVDLVMVSGRILKENGRVIYSGKSMDELVEKVRMTVDRFMHRKGEAVRSPSVDSLTPAS
ncbi:amidohydrolase family protein [Burkholderia cenocepacia]|uniref:amidohydrolase family protein n=1 Tax=Burkholderia cenocepacia TaxID=95486 RepID=UPI00162AA934|nr:amidohydrolase family protein [Burkholderia cenocepacia]